MVAIDLPDWSEEDLYLFLALDWLLEEEEAERVRAGGLPPPAAQPARSDMRPRMPRTTTRRSESLV
jgi:hypothetical protein